MRLILYLGWVLLAFLPKSYCVEKTEKVVILGSGPAGLSAAIFAGSQDLSPLVIDKYEVGSAVFRKNYLIQNYPGFPQGIESIDLYDKMHSQAEGFGARFMYGIATSVDLSKRPFRIIVDQERLIFCETLIVATGQIPRKIEGQEEMLEKGVAGFENVTSNDYANKNVVVLGAGDIGLELALSIAPDAQNVTIIHLEEKPAAARYLIKRAKRISNIRFIGDTTISAFHTGTDGKVESIDLFNPVTDRKTTMPAQEVIIAIGQTPNSKLFKGKLKMDSKGYILTNPHSTMTSVSGVFAAGDVSDRIYQKIITSVGTGAMAGMDVEFFLSASEVIPITEPVEKSCTSCSASLLSH